MKFKVKIASSAEADILESFDWGVRNWGVSRARSWAVELRRTVRDRLSQYPESCPLAPDTDPGLLGVCHLVMDRYRVLFEIEGRTVRVLAVRGSFRGSKK